MFSRIHTLILSSLAAVALLAGGLLFAAPANAADDRTDRAVTSPARHDHDNDDDGQDKGGEDDEDDDDEDDEDGDDEDGHDEGGDDGATGPTHQDTPHNDTDNHAQNDTQAGECFLGKWETQNGRGISVSPIDAKHLEGRGEYTLRGEARSPRPGDQFGWWEGTWEAPLMGDGTFMATVNPACNVLQLVIIYRDDTGQERSSKFTLNRVGTKNTPDASPRCRFDGTWDFDLDNDELVVEKTAPQEFQGHIEADSIHLTGTLSNDVWSGKWTYNGNVNDFDMRVSDGCSKAVLTLYHGANPVKYPMTRVG